MPTDPNLVANRPASTAHTVHGEPVPRRTVLVTGAARRLGRDIALTLANQGWNVAIHYRQSAEDAAQTVADCSMQSSGKGLFYSFFADLSDEAAVRQLWADVVAHFGSVDAVVNSASTFQHDDAASFSFAALHTHMAANTAAAVVLAQCLHAHRLKLTRGQAPTDTAVPSASFASSAAAQTTGHRAPDSQPPAPAVVVNLLDQKLWNPNPDFFSYTLSKAALEAATTLLAQAFAPHLRVVGVAPGLTLTSHMLTDEQFQALHKLSPLGRSSTPEDVAATVAFALTNRSLTGTTLLVDGGQHLMKFERDFSLMTHKA
ncbi:MAG: SDR family oxidoreductase [Burkholderiales bacterium]|nr:SDR family oxidoreductase [Burkholderiales bacterium]